MIAGRAIGKLEALQMVRVDVFDRDLAGVKKAEMRGVEIAFQRLQPIAFPLPAREIHLVRRTERRFDRRQRRRLTLTHIDVD